MTHAYTVSLAMEICGTVEINGVPKSLAKCPASAPVFLQKLATRVVDYLFVPPSNVAAALRIAGEQPEESSYCICNGSKSISNGYYLLKVLSPLQMTCLNSQCFV